MDHGHRFRTDRAGAAPRSHAPIWFDRGMADADEVFHVDLRGIVDLLSHHLYSSPRVYLRELVQNAVDAVTARREQDPSAPARVRIIPADVSDDGRLHVVDTGIGLDENGVRTALSTIGASTKRDALGMARDSYLGRFGIGLLSCFLVTDEIAVATETAGAAHGVRWRGRDDGGYALERVAARGTPGTTVSLAPRGSAAELLRADAVLRLVGTYARHLDVDLVVETADGPVSCTRARFPWEEGDGGPVLTRASAWCQDVLGFAPLDVVPLADPATGLRGHAYVVPSASAARPTARVYAQRMLVTENDHDLLPPWATFVRAVVDVAGLELTASREALRTDETLAAVRDRLGAQLRTWLLRMAATDRPRAHAFFAVHHLGAKAMAAEDDAMLDMVAGVLPWETTTGTATLTEFAAQQRVITYVDTVEHYPPPWPRRRASPSSTPATPTTPPSSSASWPAPPGPSRAGCRPRSSPPTSTASTPTRRPRSSRCSTPRGPCWPGPRPSPWCAGSGPRRCRRCCWSATPPSATGTGGRWPTWRAWPTARGRPPWSRWPTPRPPGPPSS